MSPEFPIKTVPYRDAMREFCALYRAEGLPTKPVAGAVWYRSDVSCAALCWVGKGGTARIKATVTLPEWRGMGYGEAMLRHLMAEAKRGGATRVEVFAKNPAWFLRNGFQVVRVTSWGTSVCSIDLEAGSQTSGPPERSVESTSHQAP